MRVLLLIGLKLNNLKYGNNHSITEESNPR
jgi:hypothetical protein